MLSVAHGRLDTRQMKVSTFIPVDLGDDDALAAVISLEQEDKETRGQSPEYLENPRATSPNTVNCRILALSSNFRCSG